ncbi:paired amphipathic helix protein Sin3a-like isoform X2 [Bolinopsis microptera]|uniref:paired amphipathic helix protein Sin3a-like isoform X2 n=1 Tax=Bolinopsis microptera TaxID=2820187 RepID=UPI0030797109
MKEFKSQSIDTPGVITRVSNLFRGRPELISGFNTFLPPGYKIEVQPATGAGSNSHAFNVTLNISSNGGPNGQPNRVSTYHIISDRQTVPSTTPITRPAPRPELQQTSTTPQTVQQLSAPVLPQPPKPLPPPPKPQVYKTFMEILHTFQKDQKTVKDTTQHGPMCETEVFDKVRVLFKDQPDLLKDFSQFLPEAHVVAAHLQQEHTKQMSIQSTNGPETKHSAGPPPLKRAAPGAAPAQTLPNEAAKQLPRLHIGKIEKEAEVKDEKIVIYSEQDFFDRVKKALKSQEVYENFLRCLVLYTEETLNATDIVHIVVHFIGKFPELFAWFKNYVGYKDAVPTDQGRKNRVGELEINYASCKRYGASYRAHPPNYIPPKCMGRTELCKQVLNDTWRSYPCWSEDSTFSGAKKSTYEEYINKCDDERFELDVVIETNLACIKQLEAVQKKMAKLTPDEVARFRLDNKLGGTSEVIGRKAIKRIYGDKHGGIIDGLKKSPQAVIPIVLKRLKSKDEEWCEARRQFSKIWNEQCKKYHLKSLDHQSVTFKQTDIKSIRPKNLVTEIETLYDERMEQVTDQSKTVTGPHITITHKDHHILEDARALIIHHLRRQSHLQNEEKAKVKLFLNGFLQDFFFAPRGDVSDDDHDTDEDSSEEDDETRSRGSRASNKGGTRRSSRKADRPAKSVKLTPGDSDAPDAYNLFFTNDQWYAFLRQHQILCERLFQIYTYNTAVVEQELKDRKNRKEPTAQAIKMRQPNPMPVEHYYTHFLSLVKDLLDCNVEPAVYEDKLREMFGVNSYIAFTLDKLITNIVRQSHTLATDTMCNQIKSSYLKQRALGGAGGSLSTQLTRATVESNYLKDAEQLLSEHNLYKIHFYKQGSKLTIELLDGEQTDETETEQETARTEEPLQIVASIEKGESMDTSTS